MVSEKNDGQIGVDELNYIQYSLTGIELDFSSFAGDGLNRYDAASPLNYGAITGYDYEYTDQRVIVTADFEVGYDGADASRSMKLQWNWLRIRTVVLTVIVWFRFHRK